MMQDIGYMLIGVAFAVGIKLLVKALDKHNGGQQ